MRFLLLIPPFTKSSSGPSLGPAMLAGAAVAAGHEVDLVDLAIEEVRRFGTAQLASRSRLVGDHDRNAEAIDAAADGFFVEVFGASRAQRVRRCHLDFLEANAMARHAARSRWGARVADALVGQQEPAVVGISVMFAEHVAAALAVGLLVRTIWPRVKVIWGGAHVTALKPEIAADARYGRDVDGFVAGYAEATVVEFLDAIAFGQPWPPEVFRAGEGAAPSARENAAVVPLFPKLESYGQPRLSLPLQASRGCAYARCAFCTYPAVEGAYRSLDLAPVAAVVGEAERLGATVSFKDALVLAPRLDELAQLIGGRVPWSACTKLAPSLDEKRLRRLAAGGCRTLEVGLESVLPETLQIIDKRQPLALFERVAAAAQGAGIALVVNYMTGFPGEDPARARNGLARIHALASRYGGQVTHHGFELERRAPFARTMQHEAPWPWSSIVEAATDSLSFAEVV